jgi:hypothetical protein
MQRKLSSAEAIFWDGGRLRAVFAVTAIIRAPLTAPLTLNELRTAVDKARQRHPQVSLRVAQDDDDILICTTEGVSPIPIRQAERRSADSWRAEVERELQTEFDWRTGPLVRLAWVRADDDDLSELIIVCHHIFADGLSAVFLLHDVLTYLSDPSMPVEPLPMPPTHDEIAAMTLKGTTDEPFAGARMRQLPDSLYTAPEALFLLAWSLDEAQSAALLNCCHERGVKVHGAVSAAMLMAFAEFKGNPNCIVSSPVNLRPRSALPIGEAFGLFIHPALQAKVNCPPGRDLWDIAADIQEQIQAHMTDQNLFGLTLGMRQLLSDVSYDDLLAAPARPPWDMNYDVAISNLGRLDIPTHYGALRLEAVYGPMVLALPTETLLGVTSVNDCIFFAWLGRESTLNPDIAVQVQAGMLRQLERTFL